MRKIKAQDPVIVISGKNKGKVSTVEKVIKKKKKREGKEIQETYCILKGVNEAKRATKGQGFIKKTLPIHISNIAYYDQKNNQASKIGIKLENGKKKRVLKKNKEIEIN